MPWIALKFNDEAIKKLALQYKLSGIPTLVIMNAKGEVVIDDGYENVMEQGEQAFMKWFPQ